MNIFSNPIPTKPEARQCESDLRTAEQPRHRAPCQLQFSGAQKNQLCSDMNIVIGNEEFAGPAGPLGLQSSQDHGSNDMRGRFCNFALTARGCPDDPSA